jgi:hypothetical protein
LEEECKASNNKKGKTSFFMDVKNCQKSFH